MATDYTDIKVVNELLRKDQEAETDNRERVREVHNFLDKLDGQWEPQIINRMTGQPRYTFDKCNPIVDDIAGEIDQADFDIRVRPMGGDATKDTAKLLDGLVRNIETISNASFAYGSAGREMVASGLAGWEVKYDWVDGDSFEQDLFIKWIPNFEDKVWFDCNATEQDASDAKHCFVLQNIPVDEYEERWPEGSKSSIGDDRKSNVYTHKPDPITVGRLLYKEEESVTLVLMSDQSVYEDDENFQKVADELAAQGITELRRRKKKRDRVISRLFDGKTWLTDKERTVFKWIPIIPTYGNYKVRESKVIYRGAIEKLMDAQRVYNYGRSRQVRQVALAPVPKYWVTRTQMENEADKNSLSTLNTNVDPAQFYTNDPEVPGPPQQIGGSVVDPGLQDVVQTTLQDIATSAGRPNDIEGVENTLSGVAIQKIENKRNTMSIKYFKSQEIAICHTGRILIDAIPEVYDTQRQKRILNEDDSFDMVTLNEQVFDQQTQQFVVLNDLRKGKYDVTCDVGPAFKNRQQEAVKAMTEIFREFPTAGEMSMDVLLSNINSPGIDLVAERVRRQLLESGAIPESQLTDEEREELAIAQQQAAENPPPPDPVEQAVLEQTQAQTADVISKAEERQAKAQIEEKKLLLQEQDQLMKAQSESERLGLEEMKLFMSQQQQQFNQFIQRQESANNILLQQINGLKGIREASGADAIMGPGIVEAFKQQADQVSESQDEIEVSFSDE